MQSDSEIPGEFRQYCSTIQRKLYGGKYPNILKSFTSVVPHHTFDNLFQLCTDYGVLGKYLQMTASDGSQVFLARLKPAYWTYSEVLRLMGEFRPSRISAPTGTGAL